MTLRHALILLALVACGCKGNPKEPSAPSPAGAKGDPLPTLASNAPKDKPIQSMSAEQVRRVAELTEQARKSYPDAKRRYLAGLPTGEHFFLVTMLTSTNAKENVFVAVSSIANGQVKGTIASDVQSVPGYRSGDEYTFAETDLVDWLISRPDGSEEGNVVGRYLDTTH